MKKVYLFSLLGFITYFFGLTQVFAADLCVNPTGAYGCYTTIQGAVDNANPGDRILVKAGVYNENVHITIDNLTIQKGDMGTGSYQRGGIGSLGSYSGWRGPDDTGQVVIDARLNPDCNCTGPGVWIDDADHVTLRNLKVRHACWASPPDSGDNIYSTGDYTTLDNVYSISSDEGGVGIEGDYATIMNCYFTANNYYAVGIYGDYAVVQDNAMYNQGEVCVYIDGGDDALVTRNTIDGVKDGFAILIGSGDNAVVTYNNIRAVPFGVGIFDGDNCMVANNEISSCYEVVIVLLDCDYSTVSNNTIHGAYIGIEVFCDLDTNGHNTISNNTIYDIALGIGVDDPNPTITGNTVRNCYYGGIYVDCFSETGGTISNNTVRGVADDYEGFYLYVDNIIISNNLAEYNAEEGFYIYGDGNTIQNNTARHNGHEWEGGFDIYGNGNTISNNLAELNPGYGFFMYGQNTVSNNTAKNNYRTGIYLVTADGGTLTLDGNTVTDNDGEGIANFAGGGVGETVNITNNTATGNRCDICNEGTINTFTGNNYNTGGDSTPCCLE